MSGEMETRVIEVTQEDIKQGKHIDCCSCPVALALKRQLAGEVKVGANFIDVEGRMVELPFPVRRWIREYDLDTTVSPFTFEMELPNEFWRAA